MLKKQVRSYSHGCTESRHSKFFFIVLLWFYLTWWRCTLYGYIWHRCSHTVHTNSVFDIGLILLRQHPSKCTADAVYHEWNRRLPKYSILRRLCRTSKANTHIMHDTWIDHTWLLVLPSRSHPIRAISWSWAAPLIFAWYVVFRPAIEANLLYRQHVISAHR